MKLLNKTGVNDKVFPLKSAPECIAKEAQELEVISTEEKKSTSVGV